MVRFLEWILNLRAPVKRAYASRKPMTTETPILICGPPGSGTSLATKILRRSGVFVGSDAGPHEARKFHESACFREANNLILNATIGFPHAPKTTAQFLQHIEKLEQNTQELASLIDVRYLLRQYWCSKEPCLPWGWKDPRNSANVLLWRNIFPELRILTVNKCWSWRERNRIGSKAGNWFRRQSTWRLRRLYRKPPHSNGLDFHELSFDRLIISCPDELGRLWNWIGVNDISPLGENEIAELVKQDKFDV